MMSHLCFNKEIYYSVENICDNWSLSLHNSSMMGRQKALLCSFLLFGSTLIIGGWWVVGHCRKSNIGPAEIASFSSQDFSQSNKEYEITFFIKIHVKVFIFKSDLNGLQKRVFSVEYVKIIKFCVVHKWRYMHFLIKNVFLCHN